MPQFPFVGDAYQEYSKNLDAQQTINLYPVAGESGTAKSPRALYGTPGKRPLLATSPGGVVRGMHPPTDGSDGIIVIGSKVWRMNAAFVVSLVGTIDSLNTPVKIDDNGLQAVIVTGPNGYTVDLTTSAVTQISDIAFEGADNVDFLNSYAVFNKPGTNKFYWSGSNEITFDALDFATAESNFEPIVNFIVDHDQLVLFKKTVTEIWRGSGGDSAFVRDTNASIAVGCAARDSIARMDSTVFWLGRNEEGAGMVYRLNGYTPQRVSTDAIEGAIQAYSDFSDARAYSYQQDGENFYVLNFPTGNATWVFGAKSGKWHRRAHLNPLTGNLDRDRPNAHMYFNGKHIVGDDTGTLYTLDPYYFMDGLDPMPAIRVGPHIAGQNYEWLIHDRLQIDIEGGVGLITGQGVQPVANLDWSDDGGHTWSNQHEASMGAIGEYANRLRWSRLGRSRDRVYRLTISDPVKRVILGASLNTGT